MASLANAMAMDSPKVTVDVIEAQEFPHLAQAYGVRSVPKTVINNMVEVLGSVPESVLLQRMLTAVGQEELLAEVGEENQTDLGGGATTLLGK